MALSGPEVLAAILSVGTLWAIPRIADRTALQQFKVDATAHMREVAEALNLKDEGKGLEDTVDYLILYGSAQHANQHTIFPLRVAAASVPFVVVFDGSFVVLALVVAAISLSSWLAPLLPVHPVFRLFKKSPAGKQWSVRVSDLVLGVSLLVALVVGFFR